MNFTKNNVLVFFALILFTKPIFFITPSLGKDIKEMDIINIKNAIKNLNKKNSFCYYEFLLSNREKSILKNMQIDKTEEYNNYGNLKKIREEVENFVVSLNAGNKSIAKEISRIVLRLTNNIVLASQQETAWVAVRSFVPTQNMIFPVGITMAIITLHMKAIPTSLP